MTRRDLTGKMIPIQPILQNIEHPREKKAPRGAGPGNRLTRLTLAGQVFRFILDRTPRFIHYALGLVQ